MTVKTLTINDQLVSAREEETILQAAQEAGLHIPTLCHLEGTSDVGACRLCLVEVAGTNRLLPACVTQVAEGMEVKTHTERLQKYRRTIVEMLFVEGGLHHSFSVATNFLVFSTIAMCPSSAFEINLAP